MLLHKFLCLTKGILIPPFVFQIHCLVYLDYTLIPDFIINQYVQQLSPWLLHRSEQQLSEPQCNTVKGGDLRSVECQHKYTLPPMLLKTDPLLPFHSSPKTGLFSLAVKI